MHQIHVIMWYVLWFCYVLWCFWRGIWRLRHVRHAVFRSRQIHNYDLWLKKNNVAMTFHVPGRHHSIHSITPGNGRTWMEPTMEPTVQSHSRANIWKTSTSKLIVFVGISSKIIYLSIYIYICVVIFRLYGLICFPFGMYLYHPWLICSPRISRHVILSTPMNSSYWMCIARRKWLLTLLSSNQL